MKISLLSLENILILLIFGGFLLIYLYFENVKEKDLLAQRIHKITQKIYQRGMGSLSIRTERWVNQKLLSGVKNIFQQGSIEAGKRCRLRFEQAGWNPQDAPLFTSIANIGLIILGPFIYLFLILEVKKIADLTFLLKIFTLLVIMFIAIRGFEYFMDYIIRRRYDRISNGLSYAIDLIGICTKSGYGLERSFEKIAEEMSKYNQDLCKEFMHTAIELGIIPDRQIALRNLAIRIDIPIIQIFVSGLIQAEEQGASLGSTLRTMAIEFNKIKMLEIEEKASRLPALMTLPLVFFLLPAMMVILLGPAIYNISESTLFSGG